MPVGPTKAPVLMIVYEYGQQAEGGAARQAQTLAEGLAALSRPISVVTARYPGTARYERIADVDIHRVWAVPKPGRFSATFLPSLARFLLLRGGRFPIWHAHQAFYNAAIALTVARLWSVRCVVKDAASGPYGDIARLHRIRLGGWVRRQLPRADAVISLNSEMTEELVGVGVAPSRIRRIPNGVDCRRFVPPTVTERIRARASLGVAPDALLAVFAGRLAEDKGIGFLIDAWRRVEASQPKQPWTLLVAGEELQKGQYRGRGERELGNARFLGKLANVRQLLQAADLLVHPSLAEGISNIVLEAMAVGLPVVGTRTAGLVEQVTDGTTGTLVPLGNASALADAVISLLQDPQRRSSMGRAARAKAQKEYDLITVLDAYESLYDELDQGSLARKESAAWL